MRTSKWLFTLIWEAWLRSTSAPLVFRGSGDDHSDTSLGILLHATFVLIILVLVSHLVLLSFKLRLNIAGVWRLGNTLLLPLDLGGSLERILVLLLNNGWTLVIWEVPVTTKMPLSISVEFLLIWWATV